MTGLESLYGPLEGAARRIKEQVQEDLKITASVGIASSKVVAKFASDRSKPDGLLEIPSGEDARFLAPLPIWELPGIGKKVGEKLDAMNISTLGQVEALHPTDMRRMFGAWGDLLYLWVRGQDHSPVTTLAPVQVHKPRDPFREGLTGHGANTRDAVLSGGKAGVCHADGRQADPL